MNDIPRRLHNNYLIVLVLNTPVCALVALFMWLPNAHTGVGGYFSHLLYSLLIGSIICGSFLLLSYIQSLYGNLPKVLVWLAYPVIVLFGYFAGTGLAALILNHPPANNIGLITSSFLVTILVTLGSLFFHSSREREASLRLKASEESSRATSAKLSMLQAQIEPHMLFNTLSNLRTLVSTDPPRAEYMLDQLVEYLRATLSGSQESSTTLAKEFSLLKSYLSLMQIRLGERLSFTLELPRQLENANVLSMILQPLVENALKHGIEPSLNGGHILVRAYNEQSVLHVDVIDTGVGYIPKDITSNTAFGMRSVQERLSALNNGIESLTIESPLSDGTTGTAITVSMPLQNMETHNEELNR